MLISDLLKTIQAEIEKLDFVVRADIINAAITSYDELNLKAKKGCEVFIDFAATNDIDSRFSNSNHFVSELFFTLYIFAKKDKRAKSFSFIAADSTQKIVGLLHQQNWQSNDVLSNPTSVSFVPNGVAEIGQNDYERWEVTFKQKVKLTT